MACGRDTSKVELYARSSEKNSDFKLALRLDGHENWVPGLDITTDGNYLITNRKRYDSLKNF